MMMNKDTIVLELFLKREKLQNLVNYIEKELEQIKNYHYNIGAPLNDNLDKFNKKQLYFLWKNLDIITNIISNIKLVKDNE